MKVKREGRRLHLWEIPADYGEQVVRSCTKEYPKLSIDIRYVDDSGGNCTVAIVLDNVVIPIIVEALEAMAERQDK